jgi:hypothetical protein
MGGIVDVFESVVESSKPITITLSPLLPNTLRILVLVEALTGNGGMDVFNAGLGDDTIIINVSNIVALKKTGVGNRARVDGGGGIDALKLEGAGLTLDLTKISKNVGIFITEVINGVFWLIAQF